MMCYKWCLCFHINYCMMYISFVFHFNNWKTCWPVVFSYSLKIQYLWFCLKIYDILMNVHIDDSLLVLQQWGIGVYSFKTPITYSCIKAMCSVTPAKFSPYHADEALETAEENGHETNQVRTIPKPFWSKIFNITDHDKVIMKKRRMKT